MERSRDRTRPLCPARSQTSDFAGPEFEVEADRILDQRVRSDAHRLRGPGDLKAEREIDARFGTLPRRRRCGEGGRHGLGTIADLGYSSIAGSRDPPHDLFRRRHP